MFRAGAPPFAVFERWETLHGTSSLCSSKYFLLRSAHRSVISIHDLHLVGFTDPDDAANPDELFVPFRDATSGHDTYGAGRYLEIAVERDATGTPAAIIDFNLAYNPYCAYSPYYNCPIPPAENTLPIAITAGERNYGDH